jgi:hypothetical protein
MGLFIISKMMPTNPLFYFAFLIYSIALFHCLTLILLFITTFLIFRYIQRNGVKNNCSCVLGGGDSRKGEGKTGHSRARNGYAYAKLYLASDKEGRSVADDREENEEERL